MLTFKICKEMNGYSPDSEAFSRYSTRYSYTPYRTPIKVDEEYHHANDDELE